MDEAGLEQVKERFEERVGRRAVRKILRDRGVQEEAIKKTIQRNRKKRRAWKEVIKNL